MTPARRRGRPRRIDGEAATERVWVWLTPSERHTLERCALDMEIQLGVLVRLSITRRMAAASSSPREHFDSWRAERATAKVQACRSARIFAARRRAERKGAAIIDDVDVDVLFDRDGGLCGICRNDVDRSAATIDHVIPLVLGGSHSYANTQLAHHVCNSRKGARV